MAQIIGHNSSHSAWNALEKTFSSSSRARIMQLRLELQSTKKGSLSMIDYIMKVKGAADSLAAIGEPVSEQDQVMNLLGGLGSNYNAVVTAINIRDDKISIEAVHSMRLAFEHRLEQQSSIEQFSLISANYASSSNSRGGGRRYNGGRGQNHTPNISNYTYRGRGRGGRYGQNGRHNSNSSEKPQCQLCGKFGHTVQIYDTWYLDSGASHHLTQSVANLTSSSPYTGTDKVFHVPFISANLISVAKFCSDNNALIEFWSNSFFVKDLHTKKVLAQGKLENGLYRFPVLNSKKVAFVGHASADTVTQIMQSCNGSFEKNQNTVCSTVCSSCQLAKSHRLPTHLSLSCASKPLELVHTDLWGPASVKSTSGARYFILFLNDYSQYTCLIMVASSDPSRRFFSKQAFFIGFLCPYNSAQNGRVERKHRHVVETGLALLAHASLPMEFWQYAFQTATFLINRMPSKPHIFTFFLSFTSEASDSISEPYTLKQALKDPNWIQAMDLEIAALHRNQTWDLVEQPSEVNLIGCKWVYKLKHKPDGSIERYKAQLVAKGYNQTHGLDYFETFSPVVKAATIRIILTMALSFQWEIRQLDVHNAFLNGELEEQVYMSQPPGYLDTTFPTKVCRLKKALYGLKQAPRAWFQRLSSALIQWGFSNSRTDSSMFLHFGESTTLIVLVYVDDIIITGCSSTQISSLIAKLDSIFTLRDLGQLSYFLAKTPGAVGEEFVQVDGDPMDEVTQYRSVPTSAHWLSVKRILRYLQGTMQDGLLLSPSTNLTIKGFSDANWGAQLDDRRSSNGYLVYLGGNLVSWSSTKQKVVSHSSAESEYCGLALATAEIIWMQALLQELCVPIPAIPLLWYDNISAYHMAKNPVFHARTKHIEIDLHFIRDQVIRGKIQLHFVPTEDQPADLLTKHLTSFSVLVSQVIALHSSKTLSLEGG
ncbi:Retrovirus-related Pol polyprotein from transposon RE1 [Vitis vinifera]|uniref:Retrovirus-related Pol polyprotein from transposon RE1 n=1 Tax=Vitis vinifera TaxID=29760 RepID=A0A438BMJ8_VITVI|nr:Retrovirus-related Pol polyprotein from transposon RE1 [Vitis vinifera]